MAEDKTTAAAAKPAAPKDLAEFDSLQKNQDEGIEVKIKDPNGQDVGITIKVAGPDSERQRKAIEKLQNERLQSEDVLPMTAEDLARQQVRGLAMSVMGWTPIILGGEELKYSEENAIKLFNRFPFIRDQVQAKAGKRAAFLQPSRPDAA